MLREIIEDPSENSIVTMSLLRTMDKLSEKPMNGRQAHSQRVLRVKDPPMFTGKLEHVASFITHVKLAIAMNRDQFRDELAKICYMCSFMSDDAFDWARIYLDEMVSDEMHPDKISFPAFLQEFRSAFGELNDSVNYEHKLLHLRQSSSPIIDHATTFRRYAMRTKFNEAALIAIFRESLSHRLKTELAAHKMPITLRDYLTKTIEIDKHIREHEESHRAHTCQHQKRSMTKSTSYHTLALNKSDPQSVCPDENKYSKFSPSVSEEKPRHHRQLYLCSYCGITNHPTSSCPTKDKENHRRM